MKWLGQRESGNVEDRRGIGGMAVGGGVGTVVLALLVMLLGGDPRVVIENMGDRAPGQQVSRPLTEEEQQKKKFVAVVLASTEDVWNALLEREGIDYREPRLVLFSGRVLSACGMAGAAVGPFYCPPDEQIYIDLSFYDELQNRFKAPGDFAQAYVIAHEVGHHVGNILGASDRVDRMRGRLSKKEMNKLSVRLELQADFYARVWAHHAQRKDLLDPGDIEEALRAASAIGDDTLQRQSQGTVVPDSFTHGTSEQRMRWFRKGLETGDIHQGDTFNARTL